MADGTLHIQTHEGENVRIGPISVITLISVICMAILAVLAASTSYATSTISERQASATQNLYANERAGQEFVASMDEVLAGMRGDTAAQSAAAVESRLDAICEKAREAGGSGVSCTASVDGATVNAEFTCDGTRQLSVAITIQAGATYRIDQWKMTSAQQATRSDGMLWAGA